MTGVQTCALPILIADARENGFEITCEYIPAKEVKDKEKSIEEIFEEIQNGPFEELKAPDMVRAFRNAQTSDFPVNVIATMSAGKSTLINALLRQKLMPAKQEACTATITELKDSDATIFHAEAYDQGGNLIMAVPELTLSSMEALNADSAVSTIKHTRTPSNTHKHTTFMSSLYVCPTKSKLLA